MLLEELVARLGFEVFGEQNLRRAGQVLDQTRQKVRSFAGDVNRELAKADKALSGTARNATGTAGAMGGLGRALTAFAAPAAAVATTLGVISLALSNVGARAAAARRQMQLLAGGSGTTAARADQLANLVGRLTGVSSEDALKGTQSWIGKIQDLQAKAIGGDEDATKAFQSVGLGASITEKDRLAPIRRGRPVQFDMPAETNAGGLLEALGGILRATASGELTPEEAASLASLLATYRQAIETADIEARLRILEDKTDARSGTQN